MDKKRIYISKDNEWEKYISKEYRSDRKLVVDQIYNGIILPPRYYGRPAGSYEGGVCDENFKYVAGVERECRSSKAFPRYYGMGKSYEVDKADIFYRDEHVIFGGGLIGHFGHFMLESLSGRLWYIIEHPEDKRKIAFVTIKQQYNWFYEFFNLLGIEKNRIIMIDRPTQFASVTVPEECIHSWYNYTDEYKKVYREVAKRANECCRDKKLAYSKIYLGHRKWGQGSDCIGESNFENFFENMGYKVIEPQDYTVAEQIYMVNNADEIVTTMGSLAHFALFAKPNAKFIMLTREYKSCIVAQCLVNQASETDWYIVNVNNNFLPANRTYGSVNMALTEDFKEFCRDELNIRNDFTIRSATDEYICKWVEYYSNEHNFQKISKLTIFDILDRLSSELLGKKLDASKFNLNCDNKNIINQNDIVKSNIQLNALQNIFNQYNHVIQDIDNKIYYPSCDIHISEIGWVSNYDFYTIYSGHRVEAIRMHEKKEILLVSVYSENYGWITSSDEKIIGTVGKAIPIQKIRISSNSTEIEVYYRVANQGEWQEWHHNGEEAGENKNIEGIQIYLLDVK